VFVKTALCPVLITCQYQLYFYLKTVYFKTRRDRCRNATVREQLKQESLIDGLERRKLRWYGHLVRMAEGRKPRQIL
jgi:hypothetical protein